MDLSPNTAGGGRGVKMLSMVLKLVFECIGSRLPMFYGGGTERVKLLCAEKLVPCPRELAMMGTPNAGPGPCFGGRG